MDDCWSGMCFDAYTTLLRTCICIDRASLFRAQHGGRRMVKMVDHRSQERPAICMSGSIATTGASGKCRPTGSQRDAELCSVTSAIATRRPCACRHAALRRGVGYSSAWPYICHRVHLSRSHIREDTSGADRGGLAGPRGHPHCSRRLRQ